MKKRCIVAKIATLTERNALNKRRQTGSSVFYCFHYVGWWLAVGPIAMPFSGLISNQQNN